MNPLDPIRHAYGDPAVTGPPPAPGEPGHAEYRLLQDTRAVLDGMPRPRPDASTLDGVQRAAREAVALRPLRHACDEAEGIPPAPGEAGHAEYVLLHATRAALDALPRLRPDASALDAVKAALAARALLPVQAAYGEAEAPAPADPRHPEYELLRSTRAALDRLPRARPDAAVVAAVVAEAAKATAAVHVAAPPGPGRPAVDRSAAPGTGRRRRLPTWVGMAATLLAVAMFGVWMRNERPADEAASVPEPIALAQPEAGAAAGAAGAAPEPALPAPKPPSASAAPPTLAPSRRGFVSGASTADRLEAAARGAAVRSNEQQASAARPVPLPPPEPRAGRPAAPLEGVRDADDEAAAPAAWEAGEDVRLLSLRLQRLAETSGGLAWDAPSAPFGGADAATGQAAGDFQPIRAAPARIEVHMRTSQPIRSSGQQDTP